MRWLDGINYLEVQGLNANKIHAVFHAKNKTYKESYIKGAINGCEHVLFLYIVIQNKKFADFKTKFCEVPHKIWARSFQPF